jgi:protein SCO1
VSKARDGARGPHGAGVTSRFGLVVALVLLLPAAFASAHRAEHRPVVEPPVMDFTPPPPGTYGLPVIQVAPDGNVLDAEGRSRRLSVYTRGRVSLLSLVYAYCTDPTGCPLAHATSLALQERILADERLHRRVRFVSLSFDPQNDTPAVMRAYGGKNRRADGPLPWHFLTTRSIEELAPILDGLGQEIARETDGHGQPPRTISHMLKLFLLDRDGRVREIYSTAFLHPDAMMNDIRTLVMEEDARAQR